MHLHPLHPLATPIGVITYQRASRPVVDIVNTVPDFHHCTVSVIRLASSLA